MPVVSKKIAVCLVGELRTWHRAKNYLFRFFDQLSKDIGCQIDYYFVTWSTSSKKFCTRDEVDLVNDIDITDSFVGKNLIAYHIESFKNFEKYTWLRYFYSAHLSKICGILKRQHELNNNFFYDQVIETRPDLFIKYSTSRIAESYHNTHCRDFEIAAGVIYCKDEPKGSFEFNDVYWRTSSFGHDIMANRNSFKTIKDLYFKFDDVFHESHNNIVTSIRIHYQYHRYIDQRGLTIKTNHQYYDNQQQSEDEVMWYKANTLLNEAEWCMPIRPTFPENFEQLPYDEIEKLSHAWPAIK